MDPRTERIKYLTKKAQRGLITPSEQSELARLLGREPQEFQGSDGLGVLIAIALVIIAAAIIIALFSER